MINSKFGTSVRQHSKPPWCKPGLFPIPPTFLAGNPLKIICVAWWFNPQHTTGMHVSHSFDLDYRAGSDDWLGLSALTGPRLRVTITKPGGPDIYDVKLEGNTGVGWINQRIWASLEILQDPQWDSGLLQDVITPGIDEHGLRAVS